MPECPSQCKAPNNAVLYTDNDNIESFISHLVLSDTYV